MKVANGKPANFPIGCKLKITYFGESDNLTLATELL
jgi:hypothetical protein